MTTNATPKFYKPVFGNDNFLGPRDAVDITNFASPAMTAADPALGQPVQQPARKT